MKHLVSLCILFFFTCFAAFSQINNELALSNEKLKITWEETASGWRIKTLAVRNGESWINSENPSGEKTLLYSAEKPDPKPALLFETNTGVGFPEPFYFKQLKNKWDESTNSVSLNTAGKAYHFFPKEALKTTLNSISFSHDTEAGTIVL